MTKLIAQLIFAMLILPVGACVFVFGLLVIIGGNPRGPSVGSIILLYTVLYAFVGVYWILLWRSMIRWTAARVTKTVLAAVAALGLAAVAGVFMAPIFGSGDIEVAILISGAIVPVIWVLATVLIWRETPAERIERLSLAGREAVSCPVCGYNMTGLSEARCPECGTRFTLDQLVIAQPKTDTHTLPEG